MPRSDNYPDDIRSYDHDPRSPFYVEPPEDPEEEDDGDDAYDRQKDRKLDEDADREMFGDDAEILRDQDIGNK